MNVDLHCHTIFSDGILSPEEVVKVAVNKGLRVLSITDHDCLGGVIPAQNAAKGTPLSIITGIELNSENTHSEVHILGYGIDPNDPVLNEKLQEIRQRRVIRIRQILKKLNKLGMDVSFEKVLENAQGESLCRPHIGRVMVKLGYVKNYQESFDKYLARGMPAYVPRKKFTPEIAVEIIKEAGGVPVLAHPGLVAEDVEALIIRLLPLGLEGIEAYYPHHNGEKTRYFAELAGRYNLLTTGGSDYHGEGVRNSTGLGETLYPWEEFQKLTVRLAGLKQDKK
ncbi:MAG: PHP domain-containing protein [Chloroflexi bacterium]|nr:PHP domain-containing protein [Chloroflexota bacterium]